MYICTRICFRIWTLVLYTDSWVTQKRVYTPNGGCYGWWYCISNSTVYCSRSGDGIHSIHLVVVVVVMEVIIFIWSIRKLTAYRIPETIKKTTDCRVYLLNCLRVTWQRMKQPIKWRYCTFSYASPPCATVYLIIWQLEHKIDSIISIDHY